MNVFGSNSSRVAERDLPSMAGLGNLSGLTKPDGDRSVNFYPNDLADFGGASRCSCHSGLPAIGTARPHEPYQLEAHTIPLIDHMNDEDKKRPTGPHP